VVDGSALLDIRFAMYNCSVS